MTAQLETGLDENHHLKYFEKRKKPYPRAVQGTFRRIKWAMLIITLTIYYTAPWLRWDRGENLPDQAILIDMAHRKAYFFFIDIWPQDIYLLTGLLVFAALGLFFVTSLVGRVWCAYACPQTVWTDLFMLIERRIEGDGPKRRKRDEGPFTFDKAFRKIAKHSVWLLIAVATGGAWIFYFADAPTALPAILTGQAGSGTYFTIGMFTTTTYLLGGWAREQVCTYMCPWPRFQAAMLDEDTLTVSYEDWRGEPRTRHAKRALAAGEPVGDCVDCNLCVEVCPTGIDIRDGIQLECINCGLCVDACNGVMAKLDRPNYLIRHDTERNRTLLRDGIARTWKILRPRTVIYAMLLFVTGSLLLAGLVTRAPVAFDILADRAPLYVTLSDGTIRNGYTLKLMNKAHEEKRFSLEVSGLYEGKVSGLIEINAQADKVTTIHTHVIAAAVGPPAQQFTMRLTDLDSGKIVEEPAVFRRPAR